MLKEHHHYLQADLGQLAAEAAPRAGFRCPLRPHRIRQDFEHIFKSVKPHYQRNYALIRGS